MRLRLDKPDELIMRQKPDVKRGFNFIMVGIIGHDTSNGSRPRRTSVLTFNRSAVLAISSAVRMTCPAHFCETLERLQPIASAMSCCVKPLKASKRLISSPVVISGLVCLVTLTSYI